MQCLLEKRYIYSFIVCLWMKRDTYTSNGLERHCLQISRSAENLNTFPANMKMSLWKAEGNSFWFLKASLVSTIVPRQKRDEMCTLCCQVAVDGKLQLCSLTLTSFITHSSALPVLSMTMTSLLFLATAGRVCLEVYLFYKCMEKKSERSSGDNHQLHNLE